MDRRNQILDVKDIYKPTRTTYYRNREVTRRHPHDAGYDTYPTFNVIPREPPAWYKMALDMPRLYWPQPRNHDCHRGHYRSMRRQLPPNNLPRPPSDRRGRNMNILFSFLAIFTIAIVVATPLFFVYIFTEGTPTTAGTINLELTLSNKFQNGMEDSTSGVFRSTAVELCTEIENATEEKFPQDTYRECRLDTLRNGSITAALVLTISGMYNIPDNDVYVLAITSHMGVARSLGKFTVVVGSVVVTSASYTTRGVTTIITTRTSTPQPTPSTSVPPAMEMNDSMTTPGEELTISCTVRYAPPGWDDFSVVSVDNDDIHATAYSNRTIEQGNNSYIVTLQQGTPNMILSVMFPNTTAHCTARGSYVCTLTENGIIVINDTATLIITDDASSLGITGNAVIKEGDRYEMNCSSTLATEGGELHLYMRPANSSVFIKATKVPIVTVGDINDSCYQTVTKSYNFFAEKNQNGTELHCVATNGILSSSETSSSISIVVECAEMEMNDSTTTPGEELNISCTVRYAPSGWDGFSVVSVDTDDIHATAYSNGTIEQGNNSYIVTLQQGTPNMILSVLFPNTTTHCTARGSYVCTLTDNGIIVINDTATVIITDDASSLGITGNAVIKEGDRYEMNCSSTLATEGGELHLYMRPANSSVFLKATEVPIVTVGDINDSCYQTVTKSYNFFAEKNQNGTELHCVATNGILSSSETSSSISIVVEFADFSTTFHLERKTWKAEYQDKISQDYVALAAELEYDIDYVYKRSSVKDNYKRSRVVGLEPGSVQAHIRIEIDLQVVIIDSSNNIITTKLNEVDIVGAFVDTLPTVADELPDSELYDIDTDQITGVVVADPLLPADECTSQTDVVFLLDGSGSVGDTNFQIMKYFIKNFTASVAIGSNALQFGVVTFSTKVKNEFWLNEYLSARSILNAVDSIVYIGKSTYTALGLTFVRLNSFTEQNGARENAKKVIILMTDGKSTDNPDPIASTLKSEGVVIICVGIGSGIDRDQLNTIAYNTTYVFQVTDFDVLINIKTAVQRSSCDTGANDRKRK